MAHEAVQRQATLIAGALCTGAGEAALAVRQEDWEMVAEHAEAAQKAAEELHHLALAVNAPAVAAEEQEDKDREREDWEKLRKAEREAREWREMRGGKA